MVIIISQMLYDSLPTWLMLQLTWLPRQHEEW